MNVLFALLSTLSSANVSFTRRIAARSFLYASGARITQSSMNRAYASPVVCMRSVKNFQENALIKGESKPPSDPVLTRLGRLAVGRELPHRADAIGTPARNPS